MATLDIRQLPPEPITEIQFDNSPDRITNFGKTIILSGHNNRLLCTFENLDNFIAALQKAKELWGPK